MGSLFSISVSVHERMQIKIIRDGMEERKKFSPVGGNDIQKVQEHVWISWVRHIREEKKKRAGIYTYIYAKGPPTGTVSIAWA